MDVSIVSVFIVNNAAMSMSVQICLSACFDQIWAGVGGPYLAGWDIKNQLPTSGFFTALTWNGPSTLTVLDLFTPWHPPQQLEPRPW